MCLKSFLVPNSLILHLLFQHKHISQFSCAESLCHRKFQNVRSFRKHLVKHIHVKNEVNSTISNRCFDTDLSSDDLSNTNDNSPVSVAIKTNEFVAAVTENNYNFETVVWNLFPN